MPRFVVHEHHASRLHWDFRLEMDGVLKSWAVPKGPPTEPGVKRLAILVEDHPLSYADFQGEIEEGYGKGTVSIWDSGTFELEERSDEVIGVRLEGSVLKGRYKLVFTGFGKGDGWLLMKSRDAPGPEGAPVPAKERPAASPARRGAGAKRSAGAEKRPATSRRA